MKVKRPVPAGPKAKTLMIVDRAGDRPIRFRIDLDDGAGVERILKIDFSEEMLAIVIHNLQELAEAEAGTWICIE